MLGSCARPLICPSVIEPKGLPMVDYEDIPSVGALSDALRSAVETQHIRPRYKVPDTALALLAGQVKLHSDAVVALCERRLPSSAFPVARSALEAMEDAVFLARAHTENEYMLLGAKAAIGAELALDNVHDEAQNALSAIDQTKTRARPTTQTDESSDVLTNAWKRHYPDAPNVMRRARQSVEATYGDGQWHWSGIPRTQLHKKVGCRLDDGSLGPIFNSMYTALSARTHAGLHSPVVALDKTTVELDFSKDIDRDSTFAQACVQIALLGSLSAITKRFESTS